MTVYHATPTLSLFHLSDAFYRGVLGPVGSGKSTAMCAEIMRRAREQAPGLDGKRKTRFAVVRSTYRELADTTMKTWLDWFPSEVYGPPRSTDNSHTIRRDDVELEVLFRALDRPEDVKKLLSLELTGAWVNEARETPKGIIDMLGDRVGRFPAHREGGCTWRGVIMDTNPPDDDHWWYRLAEEGRPEGWAFFRQPGGVLETGPEVFGENPEAENVENLEPGYYRTRMSGKTADYIRVYYGAQYGFVRDGKPVVPEYRDKVHCREIEPIPGRPILVGIDFGLTPAAILAQKTVMGQWRWIDELVTEDMGAERFGELLGEKLRGEYPGFDFDIWGDPAGDDRAQTDERTPFMMLRAKGIEARPAPSNDPVLRQEALATPMMRMIDGEPGFLVSPRCRVARKGLAGGYCYRRLQVAGAERYENKPLKNRFSHPVEAGQYAMLGGGAGTALIRRPDHLRRQPKQTRSESSYEVLGR